MLFSSLLFLYVFLPAVLILILLSPRRWHNGLLLFASLFFYAWGGVSYSLLLLGSILLNYAIGLAIDRAGTPMRKRNWLITGLIVNIGLLVIFKYTNFFLDNLNLYLPAAQRIDFKPIVLPLGISFFTFQAISYIVDVYQHRTPVQRKLPHLALYIAFFPQLIAGPIVRYHDIAHQIRARRMSWPLFASGVERFILGLAKKVLLANNFAPLADDIFAVAPTDLDPLSAWMGVLMYTLQIYFDFSGYSDMAIGLGRMFGFRIPENFNFPYIARSIREFWRRWHISLSQWFRDYLYIPLGGNRKGNGRTYFNLFVVFLLTGLWHGAAWNFLLWGLFHGLFLILERLGLEKWLERTGRWSGHIYTLLVVMLAWVLFRAPNLDHAWHYYRALFGRGAPSDTPFDLAFYLGPEFWLALGIGLLACTPVFRVLTKIMEKSFRGKPVDVVFQLITTLGLMLMFLYATLELATESYNPFIYFRF
ncbi:MBOAT family O-acyltransferase [Flavilitoribacter nigricans]|uniref:Membrane-bound O-acyltransferase family protein n=1 Tax=Flavilitoribacter nigricans (strain ATCC 23147 / DSM 23189 / NBRC 102662 / NCIMB 1420 / SS-2) TaxID=1122177 RepID=A0A2D0N2R5_FLAN2|nr:MBOAT family protein [Flavilitoribacter nigricans]PHN02842.1 membrane-bound O-acyltransferase family protein [Flavilitoribacter nigricans DSM 23189 = NBRC 102662]